MSDSREFLTGSILDGILIASISPYFLDRESFWFKENIKQILEARKTQSFFQDNTIYIEKDGEINLSQFLRQLDEMGYEVVHEVREPGELSRRGGIIDIFPINLNQAIRIEFYGNQIENIEKLPIIVENEKESKERIKKKLKRQKLFSQLGTLKIGDFLVHLDHGVGRFAGISYLVSGISEAEKEQNTKYLPTEDLPKGDKIQDTRYYVLEYAKGDKLYIPFGLERKLNRYVGFNEPRISRLSSPIWIKTKGRIKEETEKLAKELLEIYTQREVANRPCYSPDNEFDAQLVSTFPYEETPDQIQAMEDIKKDLQEKEEPMDRIVCGDVGFGKTEVALRAMVKAVNNSYQAALICPTTILASQHYQTFIKRIGELPMIVGLLSRLQSENEQKKILEKLKDGKIDILIGTHRVLSDDVGFKNLGLLAIDDEQRFGVKQKEKLRKIRISLDVLSLSATPIPRTLYLAMSSLKNISIIQTPPSCRQSVKTFVLPWSKKIIKTAIDKEIKRGGQVYYLHNRVETIEAIKKFLEKLLPKAKFGIVHGRVGEKYLVKVMDDFSNKKIDVLIATTIIENGIDLPNVNTLIAADSARLGLSQAYQIRGRIGRSHIQAFAYFLHNGNLPDLARERLEALEEAQELGSGYRIALKDLELRGAGNILGKEQSGNINHVGLNLYCQMLSDAIEKMKKS